MKGCGILECEIEIGDGGIGVGKFCNFEIFVVYGKGIFGA